VIVNSLPPETLHLPFEDGPFRMAMGLVACPEPEWLELDDRYVEEMAQRRALLETRRADLFAAVAGSEVARAEVLALVASHLTTRHPDWFRREGTGLLNQLTGEHWDLESPAHDPLELAGRLVQEDFCIIRPDPAGAMLEAGIVCFPSRWRLAEKIGRPLVDVHGPVPFYAEKLGNPVDRFMRHLKPGRIAMRMNWSVVDDASLFQPGGKHRTAADPSFTEANAGTRLFLRTERQTFRLLESSGAVLFTIRVHSTPLARIAAIPGAAARLAGAVRALPEPMRAYKSLPVFQGALLAWLDAAARRAIVPTA
jgi:hypothetical protein